MFNSIKIDREVDTIISFIKKVYTDTKKNKIVIGVSGGLDSSIVLYLLVKAIGKENVIALHLSYKDYSLNKKILVDKIVENNKLQRTSFYNKKIDVLVDTIINENNISDSVRIGNIISRVRMMLLFDEAKKRNALVCGTENKSEYLLGYYTRFGDSASDIEPIRHLYKTHIYELAKMLKIPTKIINLKPSADFYKGQSDEDEFGFSYKEADKIMYLYIDKKESKENIIKMGFNKKVVEKIIRKINENSYKLQVPYYLK